MATRNPKAEVVRLAEAKRAIRKMKQKRKEAKRVMPLKPSTADRRVSLQENIDKFTEVASAIPDKTKEFRKPKIVITETDSGGRDTVIQNDETSEWEEFSFDNDVSSSNPDPPADEFSPAYLVVKSVEKKYSRKRIPSSNEVDDQQESPVKELSKKPPLKTRKRRLLKVKKIKRRAKETRVPMSVTMSAANSGNCVFSVSPLGPCSRRGSEAEETFCAKVSSEISSNRSQRSFSVTTVKDTLLPAMEGMAIDGDHEDADCSYSSVDGNVFPEMVDGLEDIPSDMGVTEVIKQMTNNSTNAVFHFIDGCVILHLKHPASFVFCGQVQIEVLKGIVDILGYSLTSAAGSLPVFSPRGSSLLTMHTVLSDEETGSSAADLNSSTVTALIQEGNAGDAFLMLKKAENILPRFLEQYVSTKLFPQLNATQIEDPFGKAGKKLNCIFSPPSGCRIFQKGESWDEVGEHVMEKQNGCTVLCGGKGVGKSTMLRFLVNRLLSSGKKGVLLIDFDPGQAELTVPGCVSISIIQKPLLGPNFTHQQIPDRCFYVGDVNVSNCVSRYVDACVAVINHWQAQEKFKDMPCLVNTMGFSKGLGVTLMVQLLSILQPTSVIQIMSKSDKHNYPKLLSVDYVKRNSSNSPFRLKLDMQTPNQGRRLSFASNINFELHVVDSAAESVSGKQQQLGLDARSLREISILSYFCKAVSPPRFSILEAIPYCVPLDANYLNICHESVPPTITLSVFNANLVALCIANPKEKDIVKTSIPGLPSIITSLPLAECLGFGIVRGICMDSKQLYVITPLSPSKLIDVNCLVVGAITIPACVLLTPPKEPGPVPYAVVGESQHTAQPSKRSFRFMKFTANP